MLEPELYRNYLLLLMFDTVITVVHVNVLYSYKSKRYRDKLRTEVKELESLLPVDRPTLHRKLDSQTVYRLVIAFLRIKAVLNGKLLYFFLVVSENIINQLAKYFVYSWMTSGISEWISHPAKRIYYVET